VNQKSSEIRDFILKNIERYPTGIGPILANTFNISRQRAHVYIAREVKNGNLIKVGNTRWTRYFLAGGKHIEFKLRNKPGLAEDQIWSQYLKPMLLNYSENIRNICAYGFTEIFNNVIDHSKATTVYVEVTISEKELNIVIMDNGVGIFKKIQTALKLQSLREAILHLSKGKFTTDPSKHTGEGIFFTSRIFDSFSILSDDMYYTFKERDWFLSSEKKEDFGKGTYINMIASLDTQKTPKQIMDQYSDQEIGFGKTIVAVALSADPNDPHVSRSQAKRLLMGLEKFRQVVLDFKGVASVGQAFVDEVFRVFKNEHPDINIQYLNANEEVDSMIRRGTATQQ
jgi:anti-sigma regulatory factor (Ser/Thr protein kinase)